VSLKTEVAGSKVINTDYAMIPNSVDLKKTVKTELSYTDGSKLTLEQSSLTTMFPGRNPKKPEIKRIVHVGSSSFWFLILLVFIQVLYVTMVYGPIAAFLVEMFPTAIRYTSMSLPYHIGNGVFGGLMPAIATFLVSNAQTAGVVQKPYLEGLNYPIALISVCVVIGIIYIKSAKKAA
jgi:hypothetical protein